MPESIRRVAIVCAFILSITLRLCRDCGGFRNRDFPKRGASKRLADAGPAHRPRRFGSAFSIVAFFCAAQKTGAGATRGASAVARWLVLPRGVRLRARSARLVP